MTFERPLALLALLAVPALVLLWRRQEGRRARDAERFARAALVPNLVPHPPGRRRHLPLLVLLLGLTALLVGVARPHATLSVPRKQATVVLAIDISRSMTARDVRPSRLAAAQSAAQAFLDKVPKTYAVGVVGFGTRAYVALPPTTDRVLAREALGHLRPSEGTAIGDAVAIAIGLGLKQRTSDGVVPPTSVLLISDGARDGGRVAPLSAARRAKRHGIPISTVLVGTSAGTVQHTLVGGYVETIKVPPSPGTLQQIAKASGGTFFRTRTSEGVRKVYEQLATRTGRIEKNREITDMFAGGALALLLLGGGLSAFWFRRPVP